MKECVFSIKKSVFWLLVGVTRRSMRQRSTTPQLSTSTVRFGTKMADIRLKLLGDLNPSSRTSDSTLAPKYIASITAENLSALLKYRRQKGKHPIRLEPESTIKVDTEVQRGMTDVGNLRQEDKKIDEIRDALLGKSSAAPRIFLGSLIWNVRESGLGVFKKLKVSEDGQAPEYELAIKSPAIWLTDSAHRHFGIAEAFRAFSQNPHEYPRFRTDYEFSVEIYNLDRNGERLLFNELNAKQKKITAAKQLQLDTTSDIGILKDRIATIDLEEKRMLYQNIEVNSNTNDRHTLMTMSVFTSSIKEMFGHTLITEVVRDEELRDELAQYYCDYLYKLQETIRTRVTIGGVDTTITPFSNLYTEIISPAENEAAEHDDEVAEQILQAARDQAKRRNAEIRVEEKIHSNSFIRALFWLGGQIRMMKSWPQVVEQVQNKLILEKDGRFFQKSNTKLITPNARGVAIGVIKDDGALNIQVQTHVIQEIKRFLIEELDLEVNRELFYKDAGSTHSLTSTGSNKVAWLSRINSNRLELQFDFITGSEVDVDKSLLRMKVVPDMKDDNWKDAERRGEKRLIAHDLNQVAGWQHPVYGDSLVKYTATFVLDTPAFSRPTTDTFTLKLDVYGFDLTGNSTQDEFSLACQAQ